MSALAAAVHATLPRATTRVLLVSHVLCPYVQRCVICAREKGIEYQRVDVDLGNRPQWFRDLSPLGKVPLLMVPGSDDPLFESDVICQFLDETSPGQLLPDDPLARGRHRAWMAFASTLLDDIGALYSARDDRASGQVLERIQARLAWLESGFTGGPWFAGARFGLVDAAFAPAFRYFDVFEPLLSTDVFAATPMLTAWRSRLAMRPSVIAAVPEDYPARLLDFVAARASVLGEMLRARRR